MAPKSITIAAHADRVLAQLDEYATANASILERLPLQNGARIKLNLTDGSVGLNLYPSKGGGCKIVFDQPASEHADAIAALVSGTPSAVKASKSAGTTIEPVLPDAACWVGSDESGKGDYFGPLVVAAVALTQTNWRVLAELGVQDSKNLTDARASALAGQIRDAFPNEVITIMPPRYNELWAKFRNVNRLLAWAHARAIENVIEKAPDATAAVADQFGDESLIRDALFKRGREVRLVQMPRAERDPAVAAASILARAEFLRRLDQRGRQAGVRLPKGASSQVDAVARAIVAQRGPDALHAIAKTHFKTTQRVIRV
ncbi:MAG: ribonuclease HIII [Chloroflexota bacterium]